MSRRGRHIAGKFTRKPQHVSNNPSNVPIWVALIVRRINDVWFIDRIVPVRVMYVNYDRDHFINAIAFKLSTSAFDKPKIRYNIANDSKFAVVVLDSNPSELSGLPSLEQIEIHGIIIPFPYFQGIERKWNIPIRMNYLSGGLLVARCGRRCSGGRCCRNHGGQLPIQR